MGSMIRLAVGNLELDWGKNHGFFDHSPIFQPDDVKDVPYYYAGEEIPSDEPGEYKFEIITEYKEGLSKPLGLVIDRVNLLGYTELHSETEFQFLAKLSEIDVQDFCFNDLKKAMISVDVNSVSLDYGEGGEDFGKFFRREIFPRLDLSRFISKGASQYNISEAMENLSAYSVLHLLSSNPSAANLPVIWGFDDLHQNGWGERKEFVRPLEQSNRFLIVTEGTSDTKIIKQAFSILRPHIADFFDYVDMEEGYPFSGTGSLVNFVKGLISISVQNNVIILFDNDAEGVASLNRCNELTIPSNMRILKLTDLSEFDQFNTIGPEGEHTSNINGKGAAIECYLDFGDEPRVRWNNYVSAVKTYQGELIGKDRYKKTFLKQRSRKAGYNYKKIEAVLDMIVNNCINLKESTVVTGYEKLYL